MSDEQRETPADVAQQTNAAMETSSREGTEPDAATASHDNLLHRPTQDPTQVTIPMPSVTAPMPQASEAPEPQTEMPGASPDNPTLADVGTTFARWLRNWTRDVRDRATHHHMATIAIGLVCVAIVATFVLLSMDARQTPPNDLITEDAFAQLQTPEHAQSPFLPDEPLELRSVEVVDKQPSKTRKDACDVEVVATFDNDHLETRAEGRLTYVREGGDWSCAASSIDKVSHYAKTGVDTGLTIENAEALLQAADTDDGRESLASLYRNATLTVTDESFSEEKQVEDLVIHCMSNGTFVNYSCDLAAHFRFAPTSGAWELAGASVSEGAKDLGFDPLVGTWRGTFVSQSSTQAKCLAAQEPGLTIDITQASMTQDGGAVIEGAVSGIAHMHQDLRKDVDSTDGDLALEAAPFSGHLVTQGDQSDPVSWLLEEDAPAGIVFECDLQDVANGSMGLTLELGSATAPDAATATLTSTHRYESTVLLIVPYTREAIFADTFTLQKEG
ncbi:MAG: hypothetical protein J6D34_08210 [Atopobiaceae bacterium]|nr:hypothetical protein [Atopobiaceae bacterium]